MLSFFYKANIYISELRLYKVVSYNKFYLLSLLSKALR